jgi:DNA ligase-associated metallophosphoesterase
MNSGSHTAIFLSGECFWLLPQKAVYRPEKSQLIISDIHLGKATHFRKMGIAMPQQSHLKDIDTLNFLLRKFQPESCVLLGDLFHSDYNREWLWFRSLLAEFSAVRFTLIEGNHDMLPDAAYKIPNLVRADFIEEAHFIFSHHPLADQSKLNICGHVHPGIELSGYAKQYIKLPCFYLSKSHFILPAFGNLTGLFLLEREANANYYLVANGKVIHLDNK